MTQNKIWKFRLNAVVVALFICFLNLFLTKTEVVQLL